MALANLLREETGVHVEQIDLDFNQTRTPQQSAQCFRRLINMGFRVGPSPVAQAAWPADASANECDPRMRRRGGGTLEEGPGFFQTAQNLATMTPPDQKVRIGAGGETPLHAGLEVRISVSPIPGVRTGWLTRIEEVHPPAAGRGSAWFRDTQLKGPFALWDHRHDFQPIEGGCRVVDTLRYAVPFGSLAMLLRAVGRK